MQECRSKLAGSPRTVATQLNSQWKRVGDERQNYETLANDMKLEYDRQHAQWRQHGWHTFSPQGAVPIVFETPVGSTVSAPSEAPTEPENDDDALEFSREQLVSIIDMALQQAAAKARVPENMFSSIALAFKEAPPEDVMGGRRCQLFSRAHVKSLLSLIADQCRSYLETRQSHDG